jgi:calcineurin-like phosphoesterase family protein
MSIFFASDIDILERLVNSLNGKHLYLIKGNHDSHKITSSNAWNGVYERYELKYNKDLFILDHYPLATWKNAHYGSYNIHGHCHNTYRTSSQQIDVGVDTNNLFPYTIEEAMDMMKKAPKFIVPDFHGES